MRPASVLPSAVVPIVYFLASRRLSSSWQWLQKLAKEKLAPFHGELFSLPFVWIFCT